MCPRPVVGPVTISQRKHKQGLVSSQEIVGISPKVLDFLMVLMRLHEGLPFS